MKVGVFFHHNRNGSALACCRAFCEGLARHGTRHFLSELDADRPCDIAVCWGVRSAEQLGTRPVVLLENGFIRRDGPDPCREVGINGLNGRADFCNFRMPDDRWQQLDVEMAPWRSDGQATVVCGQVLADRSHARLVDITQWYLKVLDRLRTMCERVIFRPHPRCPAADEVAAKLPVEVSRATLSDDLARASCLVTFNSNCGVDAVLAGVPTFCCDQGAMAYDVAAHDIDTLPRLPKPDRTQWACDIAYAQWRHEEIARGEAWAHLRAGAERAS